MVKALLEEFSLLLERNLRWTFAIVQKKTPCTLMLFLVVENGIYFKTLYYFVASMANPGPHKAKGVLPLI